MRNRAVDIDLPTIRATAHSAPPTWALLERQLFEVMEQSAELKASRYSERGGVPYYSDDVDDLWEMIHNWGLFYALGASERILDLTLTHWNAVTRYCDDGIVSRVHDRFKVRDLQLVVPLELVETYGIFPFRVLEALLQVFYFCR